MNNPALRRALAIFLATGAALVGLVMLVVSWTLLGKSTLIATHDQDSPCLVAYVAQQADAHVRYEIMPPRSVCRWVVDGAEQDVVIAQTSTAVTVTAVGLVVVGAATTVVLMVRNRRSARPGPASLPVL